MLKALDEVPAVEVYETGLSPGHLTESELVSAGGARLAVVWTAVQTCSFAASVVS